MTDQFHFWRIAVENGSRIISGERADGTFVRSGYYKRHIPRGRIEAIAIWRDDRMIRCYRHLSSNDDDLGYDEIEELYAEVSAYPIPYDVFEAVVYKGEEWPPEYGTRLTVREVQNGTHWTPELGRRKLEEAWKHLERKKKWPEPRAQD